MKTRFGTRTRSLALALLLALAPVALPAAERPLFRGVLIDGQTNLISLADTTGAARWLKIGETFNDWKLAAYDASAQRLTLTHENETLELSLEAAQIAAADNTRATVAEADALLQQMRFEEMITKALETQQATMAKSMGQMLGKNIPAEQQAKFAAFQQKIMKTMLEEMDLPGMRGEVAKVYADTFSAAELKAQADFYATPAGRAMIDKQPAMQQRMTELLMPRMMKAIPKIQAMSMDFAKENTPSPTTTP